jgi:phytoene synthase
VVDRALRSPLASRARTFGFAARLLPRPQAEAVTVLYAFCRLMDDLADEHPPRVGVPALDAWGCWLRVVEAGAPPPAAPALPGHPAATAAALAGALGEVLARYRVPPVYLRSLLDGLRADATRSRVRDFAELREFSYRAAGTVGQTMCYLLGATSAEALDRAARLGIAMQLTNVLRDVGEDLHRGRVYLPADELARFGVSRAALAAQRVDAPFVALMRHQVARARAYYDAGLPGVFLLPPECRLAVLVAGRLYRAILGRVEAQGYDVFSRRAATSGAQKVVTAGAAYLSLHAGRWLSPLEPAEARATGPASEVAAP